MGDENVKRPAFGALSMPTRRALEPNAALGLPPTRQRLLHYNHPHPLQFTGNHRLPALYIPPNRRRHAGVRLPGPDGPHLGHQRRLRGAIRRNAGEFGYAGEVRGANCVHHFGCTHALHQGSGSSAPGAESDIEDE